MTKTAPLHEDWIDAVSRPVIAFFVGMAAGHLTQLAETTGWVAAIGYALILGLVAIGGIWLYDRLWKASDWLLEKTGLWAGLRKQLATPPVRRKHWFVRFGWIIGLIAGVLAVYVLPEEVLEWL